MSLFLIFAAALSQAARAPTAVIQVQSKGGAASEIQQAPDPLNDQLNQALTLLRAQNAADAIPILDRVIASEESRNRDEKRLIFSARSMMEAILYAGIGASQKKDAVVLDGTWAGAYFAKGFALVDLKRADEAKAYFDKAIGLSPMNAQFLAERGEWFKSRKDWPNAYADFETASTAAEFAPEEDKSFEKRRALRGMAFVRTEQGKLKEAEKLLKECLKIDPTDAGAQHELDYIHSLK